MIAGQIVEETIKINAENMVNEWLSEFSHKHDWRISMAGFAINLKILLRSKNVSLINCIYNSPEACLLSQLNITKQDLQPFGHNLMPRDILVWHTRSTHFVSSNIVSLINCIYNSPEACLLSQLNITKQDLQPFGHNLMPRDILVWHTRSTHFMFFKKIQLHKLRRWIYMLFLLESFLSVVHFVGSEMEMQMNRTYCSLSLYALKLDDYKGQPLIIVITPTRKTLTRLPDMTRCFLLFIIFLSNAHLS
uniref:Galactosylgalactosylxylosylprotein 3-beta-glucuronosyltransferase n=1 Tax=Ascaris lumbricoides TaxID=6252 RepID=A0A0M3ITI3_ASCLU